MKSQKSIRLIRFFIYFLSVAIVLYLSACSAIPSLRPNEPKIIIVRNTTGIDLNRVDIIEIKKGDFEGGRFGSISPVPKDTSQILARGSSPPPLPGVIGVRWADIRGMKFYKKVFLDQMLKQSTGRPGEALVFEMLQSGDVRVYLESSN